MKNIWKNSILSYKASFLGKPFEGLSSYFSRCSHIKKMTPVFIGGVGKLIFDISKIIPSDSNDFLISKVCHL